MSAQPAVVSPPPLRVLPIPDHAVPAFTPGADDAAQPDERQLAMPLELARHPSPSSRAHLEATYGRGTGWSRRSRWLTEDDDETDAPSRPLVPPTDMPHLEAWTTRLVPALLEAAAGSRPTQQLMRWVSPAVYDALVRRHTRAVRRGSAVRRPLRVIKTVLAEPTPAIVEASVVFSDGSRVRAAAVRFVPVDGRWVADAFEVG